MISFVREWFLLYLRRIFNVLDVFNLLDLFYLFFDLPWMRGLFV